MTVFRAPSAIPPPLVPASDNGETNAASQMENQLLALLPSKDKRQLEALCQPAQLALTQVLCQAGSPTQYVYFPVNAYISLVATRTGGTTGPSSLAAPQVADLGVEVGMVGREGLLGAELVLGVATSPLQAIVQGPGLALRVAASAFKRQLSLSEPMRRHFLRYVYVLMAQQATAATCLRFHQIGPRLARWLLMSQDRAHADQFHMTQEFLANMLGVRRVGVTAAASAMQKRGLISYRRGALQVLDRIGLEAAACPCYAIGQDIHASVLQVQLFSGGAKS